MQLPTKVIRRDVVQCRGKKFLWVCDNGQTYGTAELAKIIGKTVQGLVKCAEKHGPTSPKIFSEKKPKCRKRILTCEPGDIVIHKGAKVWVAEVYCRGFEPRSGIITSGERSFIIVCRILPDRLNPEDGQILKNNPFLIEDNWEHQS